jgi:hypothetical protein
MDPRNRAARLSRSRITAAARLIILAALTLGLALAATALAAHPKAGRKYVGTTSQAKVNGFHAPVSFTVSTNGTQLKHFKYGSLGCQGAGGFRPGVSPYTGANLAPVRPLTVTAKGTFSIANSKHSTKTKAGVPTTTTTITSVTGKFVSAKSASGKITFSQKYVQPKSHFTCGPVTLKFKVKLH